MRLTDLLFNLAAVPAIAGDIKISGLAVDSTKVLLGNLFFALRGTAKDGRDFIDDAITKGAVAIITDNRDLEHASGNGVVVIQVENPRRVMAQVAARFWPQQPSLMAAVTGTNGKTSTVEFMRQIWSRVNWQAASIGTIGIRGADQHKSDNPIPDLPYLTTPDSISMHSTLSALVKYGVTHLALEASSHGLQQHRLDGLNIHVAGFTNLSRDHLDHHDDMDSYFEAKACLFERLLIEGGSAVVNIDDPYGKALVERIKRQPNVIKTFGISEYADFHIDEITPTAVGLDLKVTYQNKSWHMPLALAGTFQAVNALAAAIMCHMSGLPLHDSLGALSYLKPVPGRMQSVYGHPNSAQVIVDYAHTPDALSAALTALRPSVSGKLVVLFGCGGNRDKGKRAEMGKIVSAHADQIFVTDDNPRNENAAAIRSEIMAACADAGAVEIESRDKAIEAALRDITAGDVLLIAGKGHETVQLVGNESLPFDDAAIASHLMANMQKGTEQ